ncbi:MAG: iron-sulfur cluster assembly accessory protein [Chromatiaceae bacterium]|nr:iron-sulfur cluster assembly accessory protein [Chromatiaceae bacterium]MBP9603716.1 iron-sulfur cluster assembly accessory protein [Chromatiaceae bacterium]
MFRLTASAVGQVHEAARQGGAEGLALRLAAHQKPDGSIDYRMGFDEGTEDDIRLDCDGVSVVMDPEYVPLLDQATLDYIEMEPRRFHFIFLNPKESGYCPPMAD